MYVSILNSKSTVGVLINGTVLNIQNVTKTATGQYSCIASNDAGSSKAIITLRTVYGKY